MKTFCGLLSITLVLPLTGGCDAVGGFFSPTTVTVELVNNGDYDVEAELYIYDDQDVLEALITEIGTEINRTVAPGWAR